ncbi:MAG: hypothetical protein MI921_18710 [Cytophagales bacterium]|nr:hypothetical protein [Cytophagales bacterium]
MVWDCHLSCTISNLNFPLAVFVGFLNQIILLPVIGYILIVLLDVDTNRAMGIMILAAVYSLIMYATALLPVSIGIKKARKPEADLFQA